MVDNLFHALAGTAVRVIFEMRLTSEQIFPDRQDLYKELDRKKNIEEKKEYVSETFDKIARYAAENKQGQQGYILAKINDYWRRTIRMRYRLIRSLRWSTCPNLI